MWNDVVQDCHIYRLDLANQTWIDTNVALDTRNSKADVLWDDATQKLYVASHVFSETGQPNGTNGGKVFRYSYGGGSYVVDDSVTINGAKTETLTLAKDSTGRLWATWVDTASTDTTTSPRPGPYRVMVNHSTTDDFTWAAPYQLNTANSTNLDPNDISAVIAFDGTVGVMWTNQNTDTTYFAVHQN